MGSSSIRLLSLIFVLSCLLCSQSSLAARVGLLVDNTNPQTTKFHQTLQAMLSGHDLIMVDTKSLASNTGNMDKWVVMGAKALSAILSKDLQGQPPILALFTPDYIEQKYRQTFSGSNFSVLSNSPVLDRQLALIKALKPQAREVVVFHSAQSKPDLTKITATAEKLGFRIRLSELKDPLNWDRNALKALKSADLVLGIQDRAIYNATTIRSILMRLYRAGKPLIGPDKGYVRAGAVASSYSSISDTLKFTAQLINSEKNWSSTIQNPHFSVMVNSQVARSLNLPVADSEKLEKQVKELLP